MANLVQYAAVSLGADSVLGGSGDAVTQTPGRIQKEDPLMGVPLKYP